ncbi:short-chain dehydrogenase TIC 32, chloroplastic-like [Camellia sinensis]|uniref:short-chain dehydrogenase TIC 32, chloroplastic-like n=1 Tax=Camellia sinensis TaxID=4442 RepID=UPI001035A301|nr:short-chain dehydrogenase TIC 32, chloroplastic-like [Camellia sinensis]
MWLLSRKGPSGYSASSTAEEVTRGIDGTGLTAIVTGASSGIGTETARVLAMRGVHVVMGVRNMSSGKEVKEAILKEIPTAKVDAIELDLSSLASVRKFVSEYNSLGLPLNLLINNAGIMATPFMLSKDKIELQFATNHIGHFLLTNLLLETMKETVRTTSKEGRIVNVSSRRHQFSYPEGIRFDKINDQSGYNQLSAYGQSKLANVLHANELARHLKDDRVEITANSLHPGAIATNLFRHHILFSGNHYFPFSRHLSLSLSLSYINGSWELRERLKAKLTGRQYELVHKLIQGTLNGRFVHQGEDFLFCGFPEPWYDWGTKTRYPGFEIFFGHQLPEDEDEQVDLSPSTDQGRTANLDIEEEELLGKALADLLTSSTTGAETTNFGDSFTISMIEDNLAVDFSNLIVDMSKAPRLVWKFEQGNINSSG